MPKFEEMLRPVAVLAVRALLLFVVSFSSQAEMLIKDYQALRLGDKVDQEMVDLYLTGLLDGFGTANAALESGKQKQLFCVPSALALQVNNARQLIDKGLSESLKGMDDTTPVSVVLMLTLKKVFPCSD